MNTQRKLSSAVSSSSPSEVRSRVVSAAISLTGPGKVLANGLEVPILEKLSSAISSDFAGRLTSNAECALASHDETRMLGKKVHFKRYFERYASLHFAY